MGKSGKRQAEESLPNKAAKKKEEVEKEKKDEDKMSDDEIEFEDPYEDEFEEEEIIENEDEEGEEEEYYEQMRDGEAMGTLTIGEEELDEEDDDVDEKDKKVWKPGDMLEEGEELDYDPSTYTMLHSLGTQWPCLSFAFVPDGLGAQRTKFPHTLYLTAGTQAGDTDSNSLIIMKVSRLNKTYVDDEDEDEEEEDDETEDATDDDPILETASLATSSINKVKVMPQQDKNSLVALWHDNGKVNIYDVRKYLLAVDSGSSTLLPKKEAHKYQVTNHKNEGFALDWSPTVMGRLLSGDCTKYIYESDVNNNTTISKPYESHSGSVEDLQWSPTEKDVFASCSVDKTVKIWDSRATARKAMITVAAHKSDINTLSWNKKVPYLLATGSDDCSFSIWDLRNFKPDATVAHFTFHEQPICCVEWNPNDDSQLVVVSEDNQVTIWDMALEADDGEEPTEFPPQLFFIHQGQHEVKEAHWHPQIPNLIATTSADGFNLFITANSTEVAPPE